MNVTLDIPDDVLAVLPIPEAERDGYLLLEIACALYARDLLSLGRAAELAGVPKIEELPAGRYDDIMEALRAKFTQKQRGGQ